MLVSVKAVNNVIEAREIKMQLGMVKSDDWQRNGDNIDACDYGGII